MLESNRFLIKASKVPVNEVNIAIIAICELVVKLVGCVIKFIESTNSIKRSRITINAFI